MRTYPFLPPHPPLGVSGRAPEWEWINNTKVWLDVWDPDSGFHFPDREPGWCPFQLLSNFFLENWNNQDGGPQHHTQIWHTTKGLDSFSPLSELWKTDTKEVCSTAGPRCPDVGRWGSNSALCHSHWTLKWNRSHVLSLVRRYRHLWHQVQNTLTTHWFLTASTGNETLNESQGLEELLSKLTEFIRCPVWPTEQNMLRMCYCTFAHYCRLYLNFKYCKISCLSHTYSL